MARHPDSPFKRQLDGTKGSLARPVDSAGHCRSFGALSSRSIQRSADGTIGFKGHASVANSRTLIGNKQRGFYEEFAPTAFRKTIGEADIRLLINHDPNLLLARNRAGTLRLTEDATGLAVDADMGPYSYAKDLAIALERGDMSQMSIAFDPVAYDMTESPTDGLLIVRHTEAKLYDVSAVTMPAYTETDASLRTAFERMCRAAHIKPEEVLDLGVDDLVERFNRAARDDLQVELDNPECPQCGADVPDGATFCPDCGARVDQPLQPIQYSARRPSTRKTTDVVCVSCGADLPPEALYCPFCGFEVGATLHNSVRGPAETTRDNTPPAETTGHAPPNPYRRAAELRYAELAHLFRQGAA